MKYSMEHSRKIMDAQVKMIHGFLNWITARKVLSIETTKKLKIW